MRIVGGMTTLPERYKNLEESMRSINNQTVKLDALYFGLPKKCKRLNIEYPELPDNVKNMCTVVNCEDQGPITKIYAPLLMEDDPDTIIITFDDDVIYPPNLVESLVECHLKNPNSAIGSSGILIGSLSNLTVCVRHKRTKDLWLTLTSFGITGECRNVDIVMGYAGALYVRKFFPTKELLVNNFIKPATSSDILFKNDDVSISGFLSQNNIKRVLYKDIPGVTLFNNTPNSLSSGHGGDIKDAIADAVNMGSFVPVEQSSISDSPVFNIASILILITSLVLLYIITVYFLNAH